ncbi:hypothetical protein PG984_003984 [Apiospora sp. TS-2023a]
MAGSHRSLGPFPPTTFTTAIRTLSTTKSPPIFSYSPSSTMCEQVKCPVCLERRAWRVDKLHTPTCASDLCAVVWQKCEACSRAMGETGTHASSLAPDPLMKAAPHQQLIPSMTVQSQGMDEELIPTCATREEVNRIMASDSSSSSLGGGHNSSSSSNYNIGSENISANLYEARRRGQQSGMYEGAQPTNHVAQHAPFFQILAGYQSDVPPLSMGLDPAHTGVSRRLDAIEAMQQAQAQAQAQAEGEVTTNHSQKQT